MPNFAARLCVVPRPFEYVSWIENIVIQEVPATSSSSIFFPFKQVLWLYAWVLKCRERSKGTWTSNKAVWIMRTIYIFVLKSARLSKVCKWRLRLHTFHILSVTIVAKSSGTTIVGGAVHVEPYLVWMWTLPISTHSKFSSLGAVCHFTVFSINYLIGIPLLSLRSKPSSMKPCHHYRHHVGWCLVYFRFGQIFRAPLHSPQQRKGDHEK